MKVFNECVEIYKNRKEKILNSDLPEHVKRRKVEDALTELRFIQKVALIVCKESKTD